MAGWTMCRAGCTARAAAFLLLLVSDERDEARGKCEDLQGQLQAAQSKAEALKAQLQRVQTAQADLTQSMQQHEVSASSAAAEVEQLKSQLADAVRQLESAGMYTAAICTSAGAANTEPLAVLHV